MGTAVGRAKAIARRWVREEGTRISSFHGAYLAGSVTTLPNDAELPATSDVDINVVVAGAQAAERRGKLLYENVLVEIAYLPLDRVQTPEQVLGDYHLAGGFRRPGILADPSGHLTALQAAVARDYARRTWVQRRCEHARRRVLDGLAAVNPADPLSQQVQVALFPTGVTTHILLVAGLRNPTVRRRYAAVRDLLAEYDRLDLHETLLALLGSAGMTPPRVEKHLVAVADAFDAAAAAITTSFPFAADITPISRHIAIDGSREMIAQGLHREAMFSIAVTASRCQSVLLADAPPEVQERFAPAYHDLLADLGLASPAAVQHHSARVRAALPHIWAAAEGVMAANPEIKV